MLRAVVVRMRTGAAAQATRACGTGGRQWTTRPYAASRRMHTAATEPTAHTPAIPASASPASSSSSAVVAVPPAAPDGTLLASSILLSRLSEHQYPPAQVRELVEHLLHTHVLTLKELSDAHLRPPGEFRAAPLSRAAYEVILTALQDAQDLPLFERVWSRMLTQFAPSSSSAAAGLVFHPSSMMYLCRMGLQMQHRALDAMEDTFRSWKKSVALTKAAATKDPALAAHIVAPPTLLAYHLMLRRLLLTEASGSSSSPDCAAKCMRILQEIKSATGVKSKEEMEYDAENWIAQPATSKKAAVSPSLLKPTHLTYHLLLQSLLSHAKRDLRHLTPLLLDMEGQWGLKPTFETLSLGLSVCLEAAKQAQTASKPFQPAHGDSRASLAAAQRERAQASAHLAESWKVATQLWRSVQALAASKHAAAEKARNARIAKDKRETPPIDPASTFAQPPPPPLPPLTRPLAAFVPPALWLKYLDLCLEARQAAPCFEALSSMQRDAGVLPTPEQIPEILRACVSVAAMTQPPQPKSAAQAAADAVSGPSLAPPKDEEDRAIEMREWTQSCRAIQSLQQKALSTALSMMRAASTYAARAPAATLAPAPVPVSLDHYLSVFAVLSSLGRVEEFAKLWRHFMAQHTAVEEAATAAAAAAAAATKTAPTNPSAEPTTPLPLAPLSDLVRFALKLDDAAVVELSQSMPSNAAEDEEEEVSTEQVSSAGGELAFSICAFWTRRRIQSSNRGSKQPAATTTPSASTTEATVAHSATLATSLSAVADEETVDGADAAQDSATTAAPSVPDAAPATASAASAPTAASTPSVFSDLSPSDFVPALSSLSASLRSALLASLLAGDHSAEFKLVFEAHKMTVFADENAAQQVQQQQRKRTAQGSSHTTAHASKQEPKVAS